MRSFAILLAAAVLSPAALAANKDMMELQRDVALLQDQVRTLNDKLTQLGAQLTALVQQAVENSRQASISVAAMQNNFADTIKRQQDAVVAPVASVGAKLDQMTDESRAVRENVADMSSRLNRLDAKITDLQHMIDVLKNPPAPPPSATTTPAGGALVPGTTSSPTSSGPPPGMQAEGSYTNAYRDYVGGNYDLAMQEFTDYLRYFGTTTFAPNAQYYIGDIFYRRKEYDNAVIAFDAVLERYQDTPKTPDAHLMKGQALMQLNKRDAAAREFREIVTKYPSSDAAPKAKQKLKELGLSTPAAPAPAKAKPRRR